MPVVARQPAPAHHHLAAAHVSSRPHGPAIGVDGGGDDGGLPRRFSGLGEKSVARHHVVDQCNGAPQFFAPAAVQEDGVVKIEHGLPPARGQLFQKDRGQLDHGALEEHDIAGPQIAKLRQPDQDDNGYQQLSPRADRKARQPVAVHAGHRNA